VEGRDGAFSRARKLGALTHDGQEMEDVEALPAQTKLLTAEDWIPGTESALTAHTGASDDSDS